jgi:hypothetical protein
MDLMAMALTCDITRVSSLQWSTAQSGTRFTCDFRRPHGLPAAS